MNLRGAAAIKRRRDHLRERARAELADLKERQVVIEGIQHNVKFEFKLDGHYIGEVTASRVYFENGQRVAEIEWTYRADVDQMTSRLLRAFFNVEAR